MSGSAATDRAASRQSSGTQDKIPVFQPYLGEEVQRAVQDALGAGWLGMGRLTRDFEIGIARFLSLPADRHLVATNSCTEALHLAAVIAGLGPGDEVICPSFTYVAGHQAMSMTGAEVVFCDVEQDTLGIDPASVAELVGPRTRAIMAVHYAGLPPRGLDAVYDLATQSGLRVIEDAAHAFGSRLPNDGMVGSGGDLTCFSFGPVKVITSLEGGAVITPREEDVQTLHELRLIGVDSDTDARYNNSRTWEYDVVRQGYRCHLGTIPAAIGLAQLALVDEFIANRRGYCRHYDAALADLPQVRTFHADWSNVSPFIYVIRVPSGDDRARLQQHLAELGIATGIHFQGAHEFSYYKTCRRGPLDVTERVSAEVLTLPLHSYMTESSLDRVVGGVRSFFGS